MYQSAGVCAHLALITKYESEFRELNLKTGQEPGLVPVENTQGKLIAYVVHDKIVRVRQYMGSRELSYTHCNGRTCSHVSDVQRYERDHGIPADCVDGDDEEVDEDGGDDKHPYMKALEGLC